MAAIFLGRKVSFVDKPFIVAEMSGNHLGRYDKAKAIIRAAKNAGADAVKLQTFSPGEMTLRGYTLPDGPWKGRDLFDLYEETQTPREWHEPLFKYAGELGIQIFSSPFSPSDVEFLESLGCPYYKVASFEINHTPLLEALAATGKAVIISTGCASPERIEAAKKILTNCALLHCTSSYPTPNEEANLYTITHLAKQYQTVVGLSDHTEGNVASVTAVALGARIFEKHLTLRKRDGGPDASFSLEPKQFHYMARDIVSAFTMLGGVRTQTENPLMRSMIITRDMKAGDPITPLTCQSIRALGTRGLEPCEMRGIYGRKLNRDAAKGTPLTWTLLKS